MVIESYNYRAPVEHPSYSLDEDDVIFHVKSIVDGLCDCACGLLTALLTGRHGVKCAAGAHVIELDDPTLQLVNEKKEPHKFLKGKNAPKGQGHLSFPLSSPLHVFPYCN